MCGFPRFLWHFVTMIPPTNFVRVQMSVNKIMGVNYTNREIPDTNFWISLSVFQSLN